MDELDTKLQKYFTLTKKALQQIKIKKAKIHNEEVAKDFLDMAKRYYADAQYFSEKGDKVTAFAAVVYAHAWLDAGARMHIFKVKDSRILMQ